MVPLEITHQQLVKGKLWTVCRCGYCRKPFALSVEFAQELCFRVGESKGIGATGMIERILDGYR